jgi:oxalate decarboxylase
MERKLMNTTRRDLLSSVPLTAAGLAAMAPATIAAQEKHKEFPPLDNFKYDLEAQTHWTGPGGSAKESTVVQFPVSESMAGVSMRLRPGAMRELHWHVIAAEWAYVIEGNVRTTVISPTGQAEQLDFGSGDIWYFPKGHGHLLQGMGPGEAHFLLVFDNGNFSEFGTLSITDWLGLTDPNVVAKNLGITPADISGMPKKEVYITDGGNVPPAVMDLLRNGNPLENQYPHKYRLGISKPHVKMDKGSIHLVTQREFPIQATLSAAVEELQPGTTREMHWHPNADEWQYYLSGRGRMRIFGGHGRVATRDFTKGNVGFIKQGYGHYVENIGTEPLRFIAMFNNPEYQEISISSWLAGNPAAMLADNLGLSNSAVAKLPKEPLVFI